MYRTTREHSPVLFHQQLQILRGYLQNGRKLFCSPNLPVYHGSACVYIHTYIHTCVRVSFDSRVEYDLTM